MITRYFVSVLVHADSNGSNSAGGNNRGECRKGERESCELWHGFAQTAVRYFVEV
jgi:hypothetical protein